MALPSRLREQAPTLQAVRHFERRELLCSRGRRQPGRTVGPTSMRWGSISCARVSLIAAPRLPRLPSIDSKDSSIDSKELPVSELRVPHNTTGRYPIGALTPEPDQAYAASASDSGKCIAPSNPSQHRAKYCQTSAAATGLGALGFPLPCRWRRLSRKNGLSKAIQIVKQNPPK